MKLSIRTKFTLGMVFVFLIISALSIFSAYYLNVLSSKTGAILKDNHASVIYAREMSEGLLNINQSITNGYLMRTNLDSSFINKEIERVDNSLLLEKNNITEPGEDKLVAGIETGFKAYRNAIAECMAASPPLDKVLDLQTKFSSLNQQLGVLSQLNGKAIELKFNDAKVSSKNALTQMTILGTLCFILTLSFTYSFASYFNVRFFQLYNGIKEIVSSNYGQRLHFDGVDEFYEISLVFNEMAEKLNENKQKISVTLQPDDEKQSLIDNHLEELKRMLIRIKSIEDQATLLVAKLDNKS